MVTKRGLKIIVTSLKGKFIEYGMRVNLGRGWTWGEGEVHPVNLGWGPHREGELGVTVRMKLGANLESKYLNE